MTIKTMVRITTFSTLIAISAFISVPAGIFGVSFTMQTFMILLIGLLLNYKESFLSVLIYILVGLIGAPVFSNFNSGPAAIISPTGGFIIAFLIVAPLISFFKSKNSNYFLNFSILFLFGFILLYIIGGIHYSIITNTNLADVYFKLFLPFYFWDIIKIIFALIFYNFIPKELFENIK